MLYRLELAEQPRPLNVRHEKTRVSTIIYIATWIKAHHQIRAVTFVATPFRPIKQGFPCIYMFLRPHLLLIGLSHIWDIAIYMFRSPGAVKIQSCADSERFSRPDCNEIQRQIDLLVL